jgi:excisionase family DNA binding protein
MSIFVVRSKIDAAQTSGTSPSYEELLTPEELAGKLKVSKSTVFELTRKRTAGSRPPMPKLKVGKFVRFRYSEVISWMEKNGQL